MMDKDNDIDYHLRGVTVSIHDLYFQKFRTSFHNNFKNYSVWDMGFFFMHDKMKSAFISQVHKGNSTTSGHCKSILKGHIDWISGFLFLE